MSKDKPNNQKKQIPQGVYMVFKISKGRIESKMHIEKASIDEMSNGVSWCEIMKENLLEQIKKNSNMSVKESKKEEKK